MKSFHFVPADNRKFLDKASLLNSDVIIYDLEDSVPAENKMLARQNLLNSKDFLKGNYLRLNDSNSNDFELDLDLLKNVGSLIKGVVLPKFSGDQKSLMKIKDVNDSLQIFPLIESFKDLSGLKEIFLNENIKYAGLGLEDMFTDIPYLNDNLGGLVKNTELKFVRECYANNVVPIHIISINTQDLEAYKLECIDAKSNGFQGKLSIHPNQITIINEVFKPSFEELKWARIILDHSSDEESGYFMHEDGVLTTPPKIKKAKNIIENE